MNESSGTLYELSPFALLVDGQPKRFKTQGGHVLLCRLGEEVFAYTPICPHANGDLTYGAIIGETAECPLHGWRFELRSGACVEPHGGATLRTYPVEILDGIVHVRIQRPKWMDD
jgi:nitrite reductase/ring-hydroxylating ferredoxin subunit